MKTRDKILSYAAKHGAVSPQGVTSLSDGVVSRQNAWNIIKRLENEGLLMECQGAPGAYILTAPYIPPATSAE